MEMEVRGISAEANECIKEYNELSEQLAAVCEKNMGLKVLRPPKAGAGGSEDYSYMSARVQAHGGQSCYFLNLSSCTGTLHNEQFDFQEQALVNGVKAFCGIAAELMSSIPT